MNRRDFLRNLVVTIVLPFNWRRDDGDGDGEHVAFLPAVMRRAFGGCVPSPGMPFRLDLSRLDSGDVLSCPFTSAKVYMYPHSAGQATWSAPLTDEEVELLAQGFSPLFVRPDELTFFVSNPPWGPV